MTRPDLPVELRALLALTVVLLLVLADWEVSPVPVPPPGNGAAERCDVGVKLLPWVGRSHCYRQAGLC